MLSKQIKLKRKLFKEKYFLFKKLFKVTKKYFFNKKNKRSKSIKQSFFLHLNFNNKFEPSLQRISNPILIGFITKLNTIYNKNLKFKIKSNNNSLSKFYYERVNNIKDLFTKIYLKFLATLNESRNFLSFRAIPNLTPKLSNKELNKIDVNKIKKFLLYAAKKNNFAFFTLQNLKERKLELAKTFVNIFKNKQFLKQSENFIFLRSLETKFFRKRQFNFLKLNSVKILNTWLQQYRLYLKNKNLSFEELQQLKKKEYAVNYRLLKHKFKNSLTKFTEYKKKQDFAKKKRNKRYSLSFASIIYKFRYLKKNVTNFLYKSFPVQKANFDFIQVYKKNLKQYFYKLNKSKIHFNRLLFPFKENLKTKKLKLKFIFNSKRLFRVFLNSISFLNSKFSLSSKIDRLNALILQINEKFKNFNLFKVKQTFSTTKKLTTFTKLQSIGNNLSSLNISVNKNYFTKSRFLQYMTNNHIFNAMHLTKPNDEETFKYSSDILRATHFRSLLNKENAFYEIFYKQQNPLRLLTTITGHNIYLTLFISSPYKILWKASSGMLGLKHFRRAKKHQMTFKDLLIRCQLFMARHRLLLRRPLHLLLRHLNYSGTRNLLSFFVKERKNNEVFENYQNLKFYKFYKNAPNLCNDYAFQFLSMIWSRMRHTLRQKKNFAFFTLVNKQRHKFQALRNLKRIPNFFIDVKMGPTTKEFFRKNPFKIRQTT